MKKKKRLHGLLKYLTIVILVWLGCISCNQEQAHAAEKTYIIATDTTFAPFEFESQEGKFVGIDVELLEAIAKEEGFDYQLKRLGFNAAVQALESGQADAVMAGMSITNERKSSFDFTDPYFDSAVIFGAKKGSSIHSLEDLRGKKIAVKTGTSGAKQASKMKDKYDLKITTFEDSSNMYEDVLSGNSDVAVEDYPVMAYAINTGMELQLVGDKIPNGELGVAVGKGKSPEFLEKFNRGLKKLKENGQYDEIVNRYLSTSGQEIDHSLLGLLRGNFKNIAMGLFNTIKITAFAILFAFLVGVVIAMMAVSDSAILGRVASAYVHLFRGLPVIVLAFFIYFGIPQLCDINLSANIAGIITLTLNASAYISEIIRGGILGIPVGQFEASRSLGLTKSMTMRKIILPQAFKLMIPAFINQFVITLKDTSILSVIGLVELTQTGKIIIARTYQSGKIWFIVGVLYIIIITLLTKLSKHIERSL